MPGISLRWSRGSTSERLTSSGVRSGGAPRCSSPSGHPGLVRSLILQEAPVQFAGDPADQFLGRHNKALRSELEQGNGGIAVQHILDRLSGGKAKFSEMPANVRTGMLRNLEEMKAYLNSTSEPTISRDAIRKITVPTLLLSGELSPPLWIPVEKELLRLIPAASQVVIKGAAHGMFATHAEQFNKAVLDFLVGK